MTIRGLRGIRSYAPASIGNFAAGFDLLGAALAPLDGSLWGDVVSVEESQETSLTVTGPYAQLMPADSTQNLVLRTFGFMKEALESKGIVCPPMAFQLEKNLPRSSGLGSSSSSIAATLVACQVLLGEPFTRTELLRMAGRAESVVSGSVHLDNVAPSLFGGLLLLVPGEDGFSKPRTLPWPDDLVLVVVHPDCELPTERARAAMPKELPLPEALAFAQNLAAFVHALHTGDQELFSACLRDVLAEPRRADLVPGFRAAQKVAMEAGAYGCTLSGSGPSVFAVAESAEHGEEVLAGIQGAFRAAGLESEGRLCGVDPIGARVLS